VPFFEIAKGLKMEIHRKELLNKTEAAELLGVHRQTIRTWQKLGYGPKFSRTPGGREYTTQSSCRQFLDDVSRSGGAK
jgi:DNA-binding transcriptional MerR regulator